MDDPLLLRSPAQADDPLLLLLRAARSELHVGRWTKEEHARFIFGLNKHGRKWSEVAAVVGTRSPNQVRSHAQKYFIKRKKLN